MKHTLAVFLLSIITALADITPIVQWDIETGRLTPVPYAISVRRGESVYLEPRFVNYSAAINLTGATVQMRYSPDVSMVSYYAVTGSLMAATGRVHIGWADYLNPTNDALYYEIRATVGTNVLARSYGTLTLLWGIGGVNTGLTARTSINWVTVDQAGGNAILDNGAAWIAVSNAALNGGTSADSVTNVTGGLLTLTDKQIGLTAGAVSGAVAGVYQPAGTYLVPADITNKVDAASLGSAAYSNAGAFYPADNPSGYVSSAGATYTFANTNLAAGVVVTNGTVVWIGTNAQAVGTVAHSDTTGRNDDVDYQHITTGDVARIGAAVLTNDIGQIGAIYAEKGIVIISGNTGNGDTNILGTYYNEGEGLWYKWEGGSFLFEQTVWPDELFLSTVPETTNYYANGWTNLIPGTLFGNGSYIGTTVTVSYLEATNWSGNPDTKILIVDGRLSNATLQGSTAASGALTLNGSPVLTNLTAAAIAAAGGVTGTPWQTSWYVSSNVLGDVASGTLTVTRAMGPSIWIAPTSAIVITADTSTFPTNGDSSFSFAHFGTNQVTWVTSIITNETALTTNTWNSRIFWKGFGQTIFDGVKAGL